MAPARRKGSGRASAAAAARQQWKVGDLVLAKMKGFPAWPATISDPKQWGYSTHKKKLLVYFYGTKQIAFCNHVDLEAFTEEKKKTLLTKRQGKAADFVRAVEEIIDIYDKQKLKDESEYDSVDEDALSDAGNSEGSSCKLSASPKSSFQAQSSHQSEGDNMTMEISNGCKTDESFPMEVDNNQRHDALEEQPTGKVSILDELRQTPLATFTSSRKRSRDVLSSASVAQKRAPSLRKSRSSSRGDPVNLKAADITMGKEASTNINLEPRVEQNECEARDNFSNFLDKDVRRDENTVTSFGTSLSNDCHENVVPETVAIEPVSNQFEGDRALHSKSKDDDLAEESPDKNSELNGRAGIRSRTVVSKKNKKPNRMQVTTCTILDEEAKSPVGSCKNLLSPSNLCSKVNSRFGKANGDEHLPLVKRARARMGETHIEENAVDDMAQAGEIHMAQAGEIPEKVSINNLDKGDNISGDNCIAFSNSIDLCKPYNVSSSNDCTQVKGSDLLNKVKTYQLRGNSDVEAALPPSKRLHRALEAMSANAAEAKDDVREGPAATDILSRGFTNSSVVVSPFPVDTSAMSDGDSHNSRPLNITSGVISIFTSNIPEDSIETSSDLKSTSTCQLHINSSQHDDCRKANTIDSEGAQGTKSVELDACMKSSLTLLSEGIDRIASISSQATLEQASSSLVEGKVLLQQDKDCSMNISSGQSISSQPEVQPIISRVNSVPKAENCGSSAPNGSTVSQLTSTGSSVVGFASENSKSLNSITSEYSAAKVMKEALPEVKHMLTPKDLSFSPDSTPMKVLIAAAQAKRLLSRSCSLSESVIDTKPSADGISSPSPLYREGSSDKLSMHIEKIDCVHGSSRSPVSNSRYRNSQQVDMDGSRFDFVSMHQQTTDNIFGDPEAKHALKSFESLLCNLTRAKESIARATRRAIECAKYGVAGEVVEILLLSLEKEPSLHRRVDMFFLVDSITRSCRGQTGAAGGVYPSLFMTVLPRLVPAAAPPGIAAWENRRQCLKVLKLWLERKTFSESIIRQHIRELEAVNEASLNSGFSRRPARTERALDDPVREMEGMLVDEYGSNTSFHLPGLLDSHAVNDDEEGSDTDGKIFEAVTPEKTPRIHDEIEPSSVPATEKHKRILEDVDGELEMEDVAPCSEFETSSSCNGGVDIPHPSIYQFDQHASLHFAPPLPEENPPLPPPLPSSPPPVAPHCPSPPAVLPPSSAPADLIASSHYMNTNSIPNQLPSLHISRPDAPNACGMPSEAAPYYDPGYRDRPKNMPPPVSSVRPYFGNNSGPHSSTHPESDNVPAPSNKTYYLQPPPPIISNQFSYVQTKSQHGVQSWGESSSPSPTNSSQSGSEAQGGKCFSNISRRGPVQPEGCRFSAQVPSGPVHTERMEVPPNSLPYFGPPPESSSIPNQCWSHPPRPSSYRYSSRPPGNCLPRMAGGPPPYWRPQ